MSDVDQLVLVRVRVDGTLEITKLADELKKLPAAAGTAASGAAPLANALGGIARNAAFASPQISALAGQAATLHGAFQSAQGGVSGLLSGLSSLGGMAGALVPVAGAAIGVGVAVTALEVVLGPLAEAAGKAEESQIRLAAAVKVAGSAVEDQAQRIGQVAKQTAGASIFDETSLRNAAALFTTITGNAGAAEDALKPIVDLSAALGIGLDESARMVARAGEGMTGALGRVGIVFTDLEQKQMATASSSERLAMVFAKVEEKTGGAAAAQMNTYAGSVAQVKKAWGDLIETLGNMGALEFAKDFFAGVKVYLDLLPNMLAGAAADFRDLTSSVIELSQAGEMLATKGKVGSLYAPASDMKLYGPSGDEVNAGIAKADELAAALAKVNEQAVSTKQGTDALFRDLAKMKVDIEFGIKPPETDPIKKAVDEVTEWAQKKLEAIGDKEADVTAKLGSALAAQAALRAETTSMKTSGADAAQIQANEKLLGVIGQQIAAYEQALVKLHLMPPEVEKTREKLSEIAEQNAIAEAFAKAREELDNLNDATDKFFAHFQSQIAGLPSFLQGGAQAFLGQLESMRRAAAENPISVFGPLSGAEMDEAMRQLQQGTQAAGDAYFDRVKESADAFRQVVDQVAADLQQTFEGLRNTLADVFASAAEGGVEGLKAGLEKAFQQTTKNFGKTLADAVLAAFGAAPSKTKEELEAMTPAQVKAYETSVKQSQAIANAGIALAAGITYALDIFANAKKGQETSVLGSTLGFAATGASIGSLIVPGIGTLVGAIAGALVGAILGILANATAKKQQPYAAYGIRDGEAYVEAFPGQERQFENVTNSMKTDMLQRMNAALEDTTASYIKLLLKFPLKIVSALNLGMESFDFAPTMDAWTSKSSSYWNTFLTAMTGGIYDPQHGGGGIFGGHPFKEHQQVGEGDIGNPNFDKTARTSFLSDFDNWVKNTLPHEIAEHFKAQTGEAFVAMGMTIERFGEIWDSLQGMDPKDAMDIFNNVADALIAFGKTADIMGRIRQQFQLGMRYEGPISDEGFARQRGVSDFQQGLIDAGEQLTKLGIAIFSLPLKEQAAAAAQLGQTMDQLRGNLIQFLNSLIEMSKNLSTSIADARFKIKMDQAESPQAKSDLLMEQLRIAEAGINRVGANPQDVERAVQRSLDIINQLYALDPTKRADWADKALADLDKLQQAAFELLGKQAISQFQTVVDAMQPVVDFFKGLPVVAGDPLDAVAASATNASNALDEFAGNLRNVPQHGGDGTDGNGGPLKYNETGPGEGPPTPPPQTPPPQTPPPEPPQTPPPGPPRVPERPGRPHDAYPTSPFGAELYVPPGLPPQPPPAAQLFGGGQGPPSQASQDAIDRAMAQTFAEVVRTVAESAAQQQAGGGGLDQDIVGAIALSQNSAQSSFNELIARLDRGTESQSAGTNSIAARLDTAVGVLVGILNEARNANAAPAPEPQIRVVPVQVGGGGNYRQGAITRRLNARQ